MLPSTIADMPCALEVVGRFADRLKKT